MAHRIEVGFTEHHPDALGAKIKKRIHAELPLEVEEVRTVEVYTVDMDVDERELHLLAAGPFSDPIVQGFSIDSPFSRDFDWLIEVGLKGFQGFQYECGMDYPKICRMKAKDGDDLMIIAGVSVTCSLPLGSALEVKREIDWLVEHGPRTGLFLGPSSSVTPGVPWENIRTFIDGVAYYRTHGRG